MMRRKMTSVTLNQPKRLRRRFQVRDSRRHARLIRGTSRHSAHPTSSSPTSTTSPTSRGKYNDNFCYSELIYLFIHFGLFRQLGPSRSLYGCEIWNSNHGITSIEKLCRSWRVDLRRAWGLPYGCRTVILQLLSDTIRYDMIYQRSAMFIKRCVYSDSPVVKHVAHHGVFMVVWHLELVVGESLHMQWMFQCFCKWFIAWWF